MKKIIVVIIVFFGLQLNAQTGIGTTTPDASAKLEVAATNKGFLPPRVQLTAINSPNPITNPANGLMVFNTVTSGTNPFQVVPGYYYWDATEQRWVSLSTTVGNVQNQAIFRSTNNTNALNPVSTWSSSFNNIASGDMSIGSSTTFTLSNGFYKLEWALPYQSAGDTYNDMLLQENTSGTWNTFRNNNIYSRIGNGGGTNWGGGTYAADVVDCSTSTRTLRLYNPDGAGRALYAGATFIITKLNPSITTSTTADNLGDHIATNTIQLNGNYLSNDGGNEGIRIDNSGNVGIGTASPNPSALLDLTSTTKGFLPPRMTTNQRNAISGLTAGLVVYNTTINQLEMYNGSAWSPLFTGSSMHYAQYRANAAQVSFEGNATKVNFPQNEFNFGNIIMSSSTTFTLPENRIYRVDLNMGYKNGGWCRFGIYNSSTGTLISQPAHMESGTLSGTGVITCFIDTRSPTGSISIDVRRISGGCTINDVNNGSTYATITIQSIY